MGITECESAQFISTPVENIRRTTRKSAAVTPFKENVPIAIMDKNTISETSSVVEENKEQGVRDSVSDNIATEKKEKEKKEEKSLEDEIHKKEKEEIENIL